MTGLNQDRGLVAHGRILAWQRVKLPRYGREGAAEVRQFPAPRLGAPGLLGEAVKGNPMKTVIPRIDESKSSPRTTEDLTEPRAELHQATPLTDRIRASFALSEGVWFAILVDEQDRLLGSGLSTNRDRLNTHFNMAARLGGELQLVKHSLLDQMVDIFHGIGSGENTRLNGRSITSFQRKVHEVLTRIPKGKVTTYGIIAKGIGSGPRAVGGAVANNPWPIFVPCHRVVPSDLTIGNYSMDGSPSREGSIVKEKLLQREGVPIHQGRVLPSSLWNPRGA